MDANPDNGLVGNALRGRLDGLEFVPEAELLQEARQLARLHRLLAYDFGGLNFGGFNFGGLNFGGLDFGGGFSFRNFRRGFGFCGLNFGSNFCFCGLGLAVRNDWRRSH